MEGLKGSGSFEIQKLSLSKRRRESLFLRHFNSLQKRSQIIVYFQIQYFKLIWNIFCYTKLLEKTKLFLRSLKSVEHFVAKARLTHSIHSQLESKEKQFLKIRILFQNHLVSFYTLSFAKFFLSSCLGHFAKLWREKNHKSDRLVLSFPIQMIFDVNG